MLHIQTVTILAARTKDAARVGHPWSIAKEKMLNRAASRHTRRPRPLEVEAAQLAGHVHDFTDKKQTRNRTRLHCARLQVGRIHAADGDFSLLKALGPNRMQFPPAQLPLTRRQGRIRPPISPAQLS